MAFKYTAGSPEGSSFSVPAGRYRLRVIGAEEDTSKSGNDMIVLHHRIIMDDGRDGPQLSDYLTFSSSSGWKIDQFLSACDQHPGEGQDVDLDPDQMIGWECEAELAVETYNNKKSNKVKAYCPPSF